ncbi:hypothetical protein G7Y79_00001g000060 [Physcia stellaris]|nr:hypothetical protein G7Y79_00001g000060 [Physcia stellaris]
MGSSHSKQSRRPARPKISGPIKVYDREAHLPPQRQHRPVPYQKRPALPPRPQKMSTFPPRPPKAAHLAKPPQPKKAPKFSQPGSRLSRPFDPLDMPAF